MEEIEKLLEEAGFSRHGGIDNPGVVARIPGNRFAGAKYSHRSRWELGEHVRCTVGKRTVCFYDIDASKVALNRAHNFRNYKTSDIETIRDEVIFLASMDAFVSDVRNDRCAKTS